MSCPICESPLGCAADCSNAPWNWDLPRTTRLGYLKRLVSWIRTLGSRPEPLPLAFRPDIHWTRECR